MIPKKMLYFLVILVEFPKNMWFSDDFVCFSTTRIDPGKPKEHGSLGSAKPITTPARFVRDIYFSKLGAVSWVQNCPS